MREPGSAGALASPKTCLHPVPGRSPDAGSAEASREVGSGWAARGCVVDRSRRQSPIAERVDPAPPRGRGEKNMQSSSIVPAHGVSPFAPPQAEQDSSSYPQSTMRVRKRNGGSEPVNVNKIVRAVNRCCVGLPDVDALRVATKTISGLYDGASTRELDQLSIQTAAGLNRGRAAIRQARRALAGWATWRRSARPRDPMHFSQSVAQGHELRVGQRALGRFSYARTRASSMQFDRERARPGVRILRFAHAL